MARTIERLTALSALKRSKPGLYADGGGLYLRISAAGAKSWVFRFMLRRKAREMGLGSFNTISLSNARQSALDARKSIAEGHDPIETRNAAKVAQRLTAANLVTFAECARGYIAGHEADWKNRVHRRQWTSTLEQYVFPKLGNLPVDNVNTGLMLQVLEPIWTLKPETANRVRGRIEAVLNWATARGHRQGDNPARWRGHLENLLPSKPNSRTRCHHAALPYDSLSTFMAKLRANGNISALSLEFTILTAARTGETIGATWGEINLRDRVWTIPGQRMKGGSAHRVPLAPATVRLLEALPFSRGVTDPLFPSRRTATHLSNMAMLELLNEIWPEKITVHGFRSTFRDWAAERTNFPNHVIEMALAHSISNAVEAAYRRGDLFEKRRRLMEAWGEYATTNGVSAGVLPIRAASM